MARWWEFVMAGRDCGGESVVIARGIAGLGRQRGLASRRTWRTWAADLLDLADLGLYRLGA